MRTLKPYRVHTGKRYRYFGTLEDAKAAANAVFSKTGIVLGIENTPVRPVTTDRAVLVYQAGIANVFSVSSFNLDHFGRDAKRLLQSDFRTCEAYVAGLKDAGVSVTTLACNMAGDIANCKWSDDLEAQPFSESFRPVYSPGVQSTDNRGS